MRLFLLALVAASAAMAQTSPPVLHALYSPSTLAQAATEQGFSVAVSGDIVVVGLPRDNHGAGIMPGRAHVYRASDGAFLHILRNPTPNWSARFGASVAASDTLVAVAAPDGENNSRNRIHIFDLTRDAENPVLTLENPDPASVRFFGGSIAMHGTRLIVGAQYATNGGRAFVYDLAGSAPTIPLLTLQHPEPSFDSTFGHAVAIHGRHAVVSSPRSRAHGSACVYDLEGATPATPIALLRAPTAAAEDS